MIPDEPVRGAFAYLEHPWLLSLTGLDQFAPFMNGEMPLAPLYHLSGLVPAGFGEGTAAWAMPASPWWQSSAGVFLGGAYAFVADGALGSAIYTTFPPKTVLATSELSVNFLRPATVDSGTITARGTLIQSGRSQALSQAAVEDADGRLLAHCTSRCMIMPLPFDPPPVPDRFDPQPPLTYDSPDPYERPPDGALLDQEVWDTTSGLEIARGWCDGSVPLSPIDHLVGWRPEEVAYGEAVSTTPASPWFCTAYRSFYGGATALFADGAMSVALTTTLEPRTSYGTLDLKVNYLRPIEPDGRPIRARAKVAHRGRTIAVTTAELVNADGKRVAMATGTSMIMPNRPWRAAVPAATIDAG